MEQMNIMLIDTAYCIMLSRQSALSMNQLNKDPLNSVYEGLLVLLVRGERSDWRGLLTL